MITLDHVTKAYGERVAVSDLSLEIAGGEFVTLVGPSGCGKTTTLRMINRLTEPTSGRIQIDGQDVDPGTAEDIGQGPNRRRLAGTAFL